MKIFAAILTLVASAVAAQNLPPPSRTVYKCDDGKKVHYSDSPCLGATKVNVEPTHGLNKSTGQVKMGQDVQREKTNQQMADALRPILNETPKQRETRHKRFKQEPGVKAECSQLDMQIPRLERLEQSSTRETLPAVQRDLLAVRKRFQDLRC